MAVHPDQRRPLLLVAVEGVEVLEALARGAIARGSEKSQVRKCLGFCTAVLETKKEDQNQL